MSSEETDDMKTEYDFSRAERGKHYIGPSAEINLPVYLSADVQSFLIERATSKGVSLDQLVNELLKRDIDAFRTLS